MPRRVNAVIALGVTAVLAVVALMAGAVVLASRSPRQSTAPAPVCPTGTAPAQPGSRTPARGWISGASGSSVASGGFGAWRGSPVAIAGTWADDNTSSVKLWQLQTGGEYEKWQGDLDIAVGALGQGESWKQAATGAYDARWHRTLTELRARWGCRTSTLYLRFAHESNGNWYPWTVHAGDVTAFQTAWHRFRALQRQDFPAAKLVFSVNSASVGTGLDWRRTFPGRADVDVFSVDYYNRDPYVDSDPSWEQAVRKMDEYGAPVGLEAHRQFARSVGLPFAVSEWSNDAGKGDSPVFVQRLHRFFAENAGTGPGRLLYEVEFNVDKDDRAWALYPATKMPTVAATYRALW